MPVLDRSLTVTLDGGPFSFSGRMRLRGKDELSLFPALFTLELWNLPDELFLRLSRSRDISVSHGDACLVSGAADVVSAAVSGIASGVGALVTGFLSLQSGSTLEQKLSRAGITTDQVRYIV